MEPLQKIKLYLKNGGASIPEDNSQDDYLLLLLEMSKDKVLEVLYPFDRGQTSLPGRYVNKQLEIAVYLYNKQGAEGQTAHSENGVNRTYESASVPISMLQGITPFVGVVR